MKTCFKCGIIKALSEFYRHKATEDGYLGKCKDCAKVDVRNNRDARHDQYLEFDRQRATLPHRIAARKGYQQTEAGRAAHARALKWSATKWPEKTKARNAISNALRDGLIVRKPCERCSHPKSEAHHDDYSKPLEVIWLCNKHHRERHKELKAA